MGDRFIVRDERFPLATTLYPSSVTEEVLEPYFADYGRLLAREQPFVSLVDMRPCLHVPSARVRKRIAEWGVRIADQRARYVVGVAFVVTSPLLRAALSAVHFVARPRQPTIVVANEEDALRFLAARLAAHGLAIPRDPRDADAGPQRAAR